jgi:YVTN family beta-propeller protein
VIHRSIALLVAGALLLAACATTQQSTLPSATAPDSAPASVTPSASDAPSEAPSGSAEATPEPTSTAPPIGGVYAGPASGQLDPRVADLPPRVYVPNETSNDVAVIDPATFEVVGRFNAGLAPEHISPDWDFSKLYVSNMNGASLTVIDPETNEPIDTKQVPFPYNLFFTPDGSKAIVVADYLGMDMVADNGLYFYDRQTWELLKFVQVPWPGVNHLDFTPDGRYLMVTCESAGAVVKIDTVEMEIVGTVEVGGSPLDIRLDPGGEVFYVANQGTHGVDIIDHEAMQAVGFIPAGNGAHAFAFSRDVSRLFLTNRLGNTIDVIDLATRTIVDSWPAGGSPDMATVSPDGSQLWVSNRFHGTVNVFDPETGEILATIETGGNPHGLTYWPQPGSISLGHNGNMR